MLSRFAASARLRNFGAVVMTPNEASAMPPDLMKYLLFIIVYLELCSLHSALCLSSLPLKFRRPENQPGNLHHRIVDRRWTYAGKLLLLLSTASARITSAALTG